MPLYEYDCPQCKQEFELLVFGNNEQVCPHCGSKKIRRQMSMSAGHVKSTSSGGCAPSVSNCGGGSCCHGCPAN